MDTIKKENIGCFISTIIIIGFIVVGLLLFTKHLMAILTIICIMILPFLPFYYLYRHREDKENLEVRYEIQKRIEEYIDELKILADDIKDYDFIEDYDFKEIENHEELPEEYLDCVKERLDSIREEINSIANSLKNLYDSLEDNNSGDTREQKEL